MFVALFAAIGTASGQPPDDRRPNDEQRDTGLPNILRELGLTTDQIRQMRLINGDLRSRRQAAQEKLREANRSLDQAIYADTVDEALVAERLKIFQSAQGEIARINFENELAIRKILTPEQLVQFRALRQRFNQAREEMQQRRQDRRNPRSRPQAPDKRPTSDQQIKPRSKS
jgi:Spy/CpxP family protein refolding chaperone